MKLPNYSLSQESRNYLLGTVLGVVILGIFVNLLTDFMTKTAEFLLNVFLRASVSIFHNYVEIIHRGIGEARSDLFVRTMYQFLVWFSFPLLLSLIILVRAANKRNYSDLEKLEAIS